MPYHFKIYKESTGFWTECLELNGCYTQGDALKRIRRKYRGCSSYLFR